jgi:ribosomal protein S18 acetylase RimI-like enzyme
LRPGDGGLLDEAVTVFAGALGPGYVTAADLRALSASASPAAGAYVAVIDGDVIGAGTVDHASPALVSRIQPFAPDLPELTGQSVGHLRTGAVRPGFRRRGIGGALMDVRLARLRHAGCTVVVALSWRSGDPDNSQGLLHAHGFERVAELRDHWRADPPGTGIPCPVCGPDCRCTAEVYVARW